METKRELLSKLLDSQLTLAVSLHRTIATHNITEESPLSGDLINALLGVEALTNAIAALPLEEETQKRDRASNKAVEQCSVQEALSGWQSAVDKIPANRGLLHPFDENE